MTTASTPTIVTRWRAIHGIAVARAVGDFGTALVIWALIFRERSEGPIAVSALFIAAGLPYILFGPWAGWLADRFFGTSYLLLVGLIVGAGAAITIIWLRFGRE